MEHYELQNASIVALELSQMYYVVMDIAATLEIFANAAAVAATFAAGATWLFGNLTAQKKVLNG